MALWPNTLSYRDEKTKAQSKKKALAQAMAKYVAGPAAVGATMLGGFVLTDSDLKVGLVPTNTFYKVSETQGVDGWQRAELELGINSFPEDNETIGVGSCTITMDYGAGSWADNSSFQDDLDCLTDDAAKIGVYTTSTNATALSQSEIMDKMDSLSDIHDPQHIRIEARSGSALTTVFRTDGDETSDSYIPFREGATTETIITSNDVWTGGGIAELDTSGKVPQSQIPQIALSETDVVSSTGAMVSLSAEEWDVAFVTDIDNTYVHNGGTAGDMSDWNEVLKPADSVQSVNGQIGNVNLDTDDIPEGSSNEYFTESKVAATPEVTNNTSHRQTHGADDEVTFSGVTANKVEMNKYLRMWNRSGAVASDCSTGSHEGRVFFDNGTENRPFVCAQDSGTGYVWKPLDSDADKDGVMQDTDVDDNNPDIAVCFNGYAYTEQAGYVYYGTGDFNSDGYDDDLTNLSYCDSTATASTVYAGADGQIAGYAWSEELGYIQYSGSHLDASIWE